MHRDFDSHRLSPSPEFDHIDHDFEFKGVSDFGYDAYEGHMGYENAMNTRTFPKIKPHKYDPQAMAKELEKARSLGNMPQKEKEIPMHKESHRRQQKSFDLVKDDGKFVEQQAASAPAHKDHKLMIDDEDEHKEPTVKAASAKDEKKGKDLKPSIPRKTAKKVIKPHVTDLPE